MVAGLAALEIGLPLASYVAYRSFSRDEVSAGAEGAGTILCIGDSYTYGDGSSASAPIIYPFF